MLILAVHILPPHIEVSNRVLRDYAHHLDRFLRVQFLDEVGHGPIRGGSLTSEPLLRVFRCLSRGIEIGGRLYDFLAFGNSQLREHGVFMFARCPGAQNCGVTDCRGLTASDIRQSIGDVSDIKIVAKQAARVGQAFSTTRLIHNNGLSINPIRYDDWIGGEQDRYCFSDGVGLTSEAILADVAKEMGEVGASPAAVQFRFGGAKGVLALAPDISLLPKGRLPLRERQVALRPSQVKFESEHDQLEAIRMAKYRGASLNRQFIVVLWSLGVETSVFLKLQSKMIDELNSSLNDEHTALKCLRRHVDQHGSTVLLGGLFSIDAQHQ